jgi:hypothetical protein
MGRGYAPSGQKLSVIPMVCMQVPCSVGNREILARNRVFRFPVLERTGKSAILPLGYFGRSRRREHSGDNPLYYQVLLSSRFPRERAARRGFSPWTRPESECWRRGAAALSERGADGAVNPKTICAILRCVVCRAKPCAGSRRKRSPPRPSGRARRALVRPPARRQGRSAESGRRLPARAQLR